MKNLKILAILSIFVVGILGCTQKERRITGVAEILPQLQKTLSPQAVLYIIVRNAGETSGPPVAVKRFTQPLVFPLEFDISGKDAMIPDTPFEGTFSITARIAQTGSATPVNVGDIEGSALPNPVAVGIKNLKITLDRIHK